MWLCYLITGSGCELLGLSDQLHEMTGETRGAGVHKALGNTSMDLHDWKGQQENRMPRQTHKRFLGDSMPPRLKVEEQALLPASLRTVSSTQKSLAFSAAPTPRHSTYAFHLGHSGISWKDCELFVPVHQVERQFFFATPWDCVSTSWDISPGPTNG